MGEPYPVHKAIFGFRAKGLIEAGLDYRSKTNHLYRGNQGRIRKLKVKSHDKKTTLYSVPVQRLPKD